MVENKQFGSDFPEWYRKDRLVIMKLIRDLEEKLRSLETKKQ